MMCKAEEGGDIERMLLLGVGVSGVFMFLWVFVLFPGSAYTGFAAHDAFIQLLFEKVPLFGLVAPVSLITKYNELGHTPAFTRSAWCNMEHHRAAPTLPRSGTHKMHER